MSRYIFAIIGAAIAVSGCSTSSARQSWRNIAVPQMVENGSLQMQRAEADYAQVRAGPSAKQDAQPI